MKPQPVDLHGISDVRDVVTRVVELRSREARNLASGLERRDRQGLHDFRIACKRLRYALERFDSVDPSFQEVAQRLTELQDALGEAHDRDVLLTILPPRMAQTERRLQRERAQYVDRAAELWSFIRFESASNPSHDSLRRSSGKEKA